MNFNKSSQAKFTKDDLQSILDENDYCTLARSKFLDEYDLGELVEVLFHNSEKSDHEYQILV